MLGEAQIELRLVDREHNRDRIYRIEIDGDLFGQVTVTLTFGRFEGWQRARRFAVTGRQAALALVRERLRRRRTARRRLGAAYELVSASGAGERSGVPWSSPSGNASPAPTAAARWRTFGRAAARPCPPRLRHCRCSPREVCRTRRSVTESAPVATGNSAFVLKDMSQVRETCGNGIRPRRVQGSRCGTVPPVAGRKPATWRRGRCTNCREAAKSLPRNLRGAYAQPPAARSPRGLLAPRREQDSGSADHKSFRTCRGPREVK